MKYYSLNYNSQHISFLDAVRRGLAPDRGLYFPKIIPKLPKTLFNNITIKDTFYFVHSYMFGANKNSDSVLYTINYSGIEIPSVVMKNNIIGCQFHPEISGKSGLKFLNFFLSIK